MKQKDYSLLLLLVILAIAVLASSCNPNPNYNPYIPVGPGTYHVCLDSTHAECDGHCECDGLGCDYADNSRFNK